ncbi:MAG: hypothetical protein OXM55_07500 [Bdellovibrionales bacterium]|nr:hypothetical protein [Bdellovibrionales bacterium]
MKVFTSIFIFSLGVSFLFSSLPAFSIGEEVVFELKREKARKKNQKKRKKTIPSKFKRKSFSYNEDFLVFNEKLKADLKKGSVLKVNIPYPVIASFNEEFPIYGIVVHPFRGVVAGKIRGVKNTNKALLSFDEVIVSGDTHSIESFPVFIEGDLKESFFKDIALNFFESLPSVLALALKTQIPQTGIHFINTDLKGKVGKLSVMETEKRKLVQYLELKNIKLLKLVIK